MTVTLSGGTMRVNGREYQTEQSGAYYDDDRMQRVMFRLWNATSARTIAIPAVDLAALKSGLPVELEDE